MSPDNRFLWLALHEACKNPAPAPARPILSCIRLIQIDTDSSPIGAKKAAMKFDFDIVERNMDLYYPTLTFVGSTVSGTNSMIVAFGGSNSTIFPSLFASGQLGPVGLLLKNSLLPVVQIKSGGSPHLPIVAPPNPPAMRYGDYFGSAVDPTNASASWMAGEYMQGPPTVPLPSWSTAISLVTTFPGNGTLSTGVTNPGAPIPGTLGAVPGNLTQAPGATNVSSQICADGPGPDPTTGLCADGSQPQSQTLNATSPGVTTAELQQLVCADGTGPDSTTGLCADGSQPQSQTLNATSPGVTTAEQQQLVCADGTGPDSTTGLCADGSQPQSQTLNATSPGVTTAEQQQLVCADGTGPDSTTGLCADGSQPQPFNVTVPGTTTAEPQLVCSDGTPPDVASGLCADGSQPQSQTLNATSPGVTTAEQQQLVCADGTGPDPTTGLCADGSQP